MGGGCARRGFGMTGPRRSLLRGACDILFPKEVDPQVADAFAWL